MSPRTDEFEQDNTDLSATSSDDDDDGLKDDMAALARACTFTADEDEIEEVEEDPLLSTGDAIVPFTANEDSDPDDDLECLKRVQSLYKPTGNSVPSPSPVPMIAAAADDDEDDEDDFETVRAIFKRFSAYDGGRLSNFCCIISNFSLKFENLVVNLFVLVRVNVFWRKKMQLVG